MNNIINDYVNREGECEYLFSKGGPFWHMCTPGEKQEIIFKNDDDYRYGVISSALSLIDANAAGYRVKLYAFALMSNHVHEMVSGAPEDCLEYFRIRKARLRRYFAGKVDLSDFEPELFPAKDVKTLRYMIAYIHRNGFVHNLRETPFSYRWSTGMYYFNHSVKSHYGEKVSSMSVRQQRIMLRTRDTDLYANLSMVDGYVSPLSFCEIETGEFLFRDAHKYFYNISRNVESYAVIANMLGERGFLNDEEMLGVVYRKMKDLYKVDSPNSLSRSAKIELARTMHNEYHASNGQIQRMLKLEKTLIDELFPKAL